MLPPIALACSRLPDSREDEYNCVGKTSGGLGRGEAGEPVSISLILHSGIPAPGIPSDWSSFTVYINTYVIISIHVRSLRVARKKVVNSLAEFLKVFPNVQALRLEQKLCLLNLTRKKDPFVMLPTGFGKSINFQLLPCVVKAPQCCDASVHTADNIASPGTIYSLNFITHTQLLCPPARHNYYSAL